MRYYLKLDNDPALGLDFLQHRSEEKSRILKVYEGKGGAEYRQYQSIEVPGYGYNPYPDNFRAQHSCMVNSGKPIE